VEEKPRFQNMTREMIVEATCERGQLPIKAFHVPFRSLVEALRITALPKVVGKVIPAVMCFIK
jgi:hypothetical protein